jgi:hypothetical protein
VKSPDPQQGRNELAPGGRGCAKNPVRDCGTTRVNVWLQSRSLPARGRVGLEVHRCLCIIDAGSVFISTVILMRETSLFLRRAWLAKLQKHYLPGSSVYFRRVLIFA